MSDGVPRNSPEETVGHVRASLLSMRNEDLRVRGDLVVAEGSRPPADPGSKSREYQNWLRRTGWR